MIIKKYRFGIIGCGFIAGIHAAAICDIENAVLVGAFDSLEKTAEKFSAVFS